MSAGVMITAFLLFQNLFANAFGGVGSDRASCIVKSADGGFVLAGYTDTFEPRGDLLVIKLLPDGSLDWVKTFGGTGAQSANAIINTSDQGYAIAGTTDESGAGSYDFLVLKLSSDGSLQWAKTFGGGLWDQAVAIVQTPDTGFVVVGGTESFGAGSYDFLVLKLSSDGSLQWAKTFGGSADDYGSGVIQTSDGDFVITGYTSSFGAGNSDGMILKLSPDGSLQWAKSFGGSGIEYASSVAETPDSDLVITGYTTSFGAGGYDVLVLKMGPDGSYTWARVIGGPEDEGASSLVQSQDNSLILAATSYGFGAGLSDFLILKLSSTGSLQWAKTLGGPDYDDAYSIILSSDSSVALAGYVKSFGSGEHDAMVLNLGVDGAYPGCVETCTPQNTLTGLTLSSPSVGANCAPSTSNPSLQIGTPSLSTDTVCSPVPGVSEGENLVKTGIVCSMFSGGVAFFSPKPERIVLYSVDGKLIRSLRLKQGVNPVRLDKGVYLWQAAGQSGKFVVR